MSQKLQAVPKTLTPEERQALGWRVLIELAQHGTRADLCRLQAARSLIGEQSGGQDSVNTERADETLKSLSEEEILKRAGYQKTG